MGKQVDGRRGDSRRKRVRMIRMMPDDRYIPSA
jgi:hypothetical protein